MWLGDTADEPVPAEDAAPAAETEAAEGVTAKALLLLRRHNLSADAGAAQRARLTAADVEAFVAAGEELPRTGRAPAGRPEPCPRPPTSAR